jgi:hypothetical protein
LAEVIKMMKRAIIALAALLMSMSLGGATISSTVHGYSGGVYDYSTTTALSGNAWGTGGGTFAPNGFGWSGEYEGYNCGKTPDFRIYNKQELTFWKQPSTPDDPYFTDTAWIVGTGAGKDTAKMTTNAGLSIVGGWSNAGIGTGIEAKTDLVSYSIYGTDFAGWAVDMGFVATDFKPRKLTLNGGAKLDPTVSFYPSAGMVWEIK